MKPIALFVAFILVGLGSAAPTSDEKIIVTKDFFIQEFVKYTAQHDIVNILVPVNNLNFEDVEKDDSDDDSSSNMCLFFIEADTLEGEKKEYKGLYVFKDEVATKLLDNGRDFAAPADESKTVYFAATDGLYIYNAEKNKAEKYGTITDSIISIAKANGTDFLYILTEDYVLYKVTGDGTKKEKVNNVVGAQQIVVDFANNLYYYTTDKKVYVYTGETVKQIEGLPSATYINILKPPFFMDSGLPVVLDYKAYVVYENGTSEFSDFEFVARPTAYSMEATIVQYYAYNKKIYEYNLLTIILSELLDEIQKLLEDEKDNIQALSSKKGSDFRASFKQQHIKT
uniref:Setae polypeptide n=1 Tax=Ochrogaster lunifer TaxID=319761 RepID=A0AA49ILZ9_OCHLU|nr:setae polypeptide [Ochrogaster lunifer]